LKDKKWDIRTFAAYLGIAAHGTVSSQYVGYFAIVRGWIVWCQFHFFVTTRSALLAPRGRLPSWPTPQSHHPRSRAETLSPEIVPTNDSLGLLF